MIGSMMASMLQFLMTKPKYFGKFSEPEFVQKIHVVNFSHLVATNYPYLENHCCANFPLLI